MSYATAIGLDVHARSITGVALFRDTGEVVSKKFSYDPASLAEWILQFDSPKAVYESGVTGFHLVRALKKMLALSPRCKNLQEINVRKMIAMMLSF